MHGCFVRLLPACCNQRHDGFRLAQINAPVDERTPCKLARLGQPRAVRKANGQHALTGV